MSTVTKGLGLSLMSRRSNLGILLTVLRARFLIISRYRGSLFLETLLPLVFAALPIFIGVAVAGGDASAAQNFQENVGTSDYKLYMLLGANVFVVVSIMLWIVGFWIRREMEMGTLESIYLSPAKRVYVVSGIASYAFIRSAIAFVIALLLGSLVFGVNPFKGEILLAVVFLLIGLIPLWGLAFLFGALILKIKEANSVITSLQWVISFLMGVFFPIAAFPPLLRYVALAFPPTWINQGVRASLLNLSYFFGTWYFHLAVVFVFAAVVPLIGYSVFLSTERRLKRKEGVGQY
ncbi:MAG: ABC transporter permease [Thermoplasmata archaeon]